MTAPQPRTAADHDALEWDDQPDVDAIREALKRTAAYFGDGPLIVEKGIITRPSAIEAEAAAPLRTTAQAFVEWAEGDEGQGCRWCLFLEGHEDGCLVGDARAALVPEREAGE